MYQKKKNQVRDFFLHFGIIEKKRKNDSPKMKNSQVVEYEAAKAIGAVYS